MNTAMPSFSSCCSVSVRFKSALPNTRSGCSNKIVSIEGADGNPTLGFAFASAGYFV
jgi:hypothetical protein